MHNDSSSVRCRLVMLVLLVWIRITKDICFRSVTKPTQSSHLLNGKAGLVEWLGFSGFGLTHEID